MVRGLMGTVVHDPLEGPRFAILTIVQQWAEDRSLPVGHKDLWKLLAQKLQSYCPKVAFGHVLSFFSHPLSHLTGFDVVGPDLCVG